MINKMTRNIVMYILTMNTWTIVDVCELSMTDKQLTYIDHYTRWKYTTDIPYFEYIDPEIIPNIMDKAIKKHKIIIEKGGQEEILIIVPYKSYGKETTLKFNLSLTEKYIIDKVEVSANILELHNKLNKLMAIFEENEAFLLFPTIDPIDFMKFVNMYCIFEEQQPFRNKKGQDISGHKEHCIKHVLQIPYTNELLFYNDIAKAKTNEDISDKIDLKNHNRIHLFNYFTEYRISTWYVPIILSYLSIKYRYNYVDGHLIDKNKRYIHIYECEWHKRHTFDKTKYKYTINEEYAKYSRYPDKHIIHEVYDFEKWW